MTTQTSTKWDDYLVRDFSKVKGGKRLPKGQFVQNEKTAHPYIRVTDMHTDGLDASNIKYITDEQFEKIKRYIISSDDVYVSNAGTIGLVGKVPRWLSGANLTENALKLTDIDKKKVIQDFIIYFLRSSVGQDQIKARTGGSSQPKLALTRLADVTVTAPDVPSQNRIVDVLSAYDDLIENNNRRIKILEDIAQKIYTEWFVEFRFPSYEKAKFGKDGLPNGWKMAKIRALIETVKRKEKLKTDQYLSNGIYPIIDQGKDFIAGYTNDTDTVYKEHLIVFGDHTRCFKYCNFDFACGADGTQLLKSKNSDNLPEILLYFLVKNADLKSNHYARHFKFLKEIEVITPGKKLAQDFAELCAPTYENIKQMMFKNVILRKSRDLLIPQLVTGKLEIKS